MKPKLHNRTSLAASLLAAAFVALILLSTTSLHSQTFEHPGALSTQSDLDRMATKVAEGAQPWKGSWDILVNNTDSWLDHTPEAVATVCAGGVCSSENYIRLARDCARAYQLALRYHGSGDTAFADKAVEIMNAWASTHTDWDGDTNVSLRAGLYGYQFACAAELMRDYSGWQSADFTAFQNYLIDLFYSRNDYFLTFRHGTVDGHYWANWDLANMASMLAIGVVCDDQTIFDQAMSYFYNGVGSGAIENAVHFVHPNGLGQWQESGRDQGHSLMGPQLMGTFCEIAWNQGIDLYSYLDNRFLASVEYTSKYNLWKDVPYVKYVWRHGHPDNRLETVQAQIGSNSRGQDRPGWDLVYNHYVNRLGMATPYTELYAEQTRPEGGGFNYGSGSGGFDGLGFTTLTHSRDPIASGALPGDLVPYVERRQITLSWAGSAYAESYNVKRSTSSGGPYATLATVDSKNLSYVDPGLTAGTTYYYVVSANNPGGESADSAELAVTADGQLHGAVIGTDGSYNDSGATKETVFDGSLDNYFDPPSDGGWAGLDLGSNVSAVITEVRYCPRERFASRMVGGVFQGSNTADFSSGVVDLFTITEEPPEGVLTSQTISSTDSFRYFRYIVPAGTGGWTNVAEVQFVGDVSGLSAPSAPSGLDASATGSSQIDLSWNAVSGADSYNIKRATSSGGPYIIAANVTGTSYSDTGLAGGTTYYYVVTASNSAGESANSNEAGATTEAGPSVITNGTYTIVARHSGKVLEVADSSTADGANVQQWAADGGNTQTWTVTHLGNAEHQVLGVQSGKSLDVSGASTADGANVIIWPWNDATNQRFTFTATDNDYYRITPVHSGKSIEVDGSSTTDGANVQQWAYTEGLNQQWKLLEAEASGTATMHVADIQANRVSQGDGQSKAEAVVTVVDDQDAAVSDTTVTVVFTGAIEETKSGVTDANGVATILTDTSASNPARTTACVDDIAHSSYTYDPQSNAVTCDDT